MATTINLVDGYILEVDGNYVLFSDYRNFETVVRIEILNYNGQKIVWDVYGEEWVYDDGSEIEWGEVFDKPKENS